MTTSQIKYIVNTVLEDTTDDFTLLDKCKYLIIDTFYAKYGDKQTMFYFDTTNEILSLYECKEVKRVPSHENYKIIDSTIYELQYNADGIVGEHYCFNDITSFTLK